MAQIVFEYSGTGTASDPSGSVGGDSTGEAIVGGALDTLFPDISAEESANGQVDYRCLYVHNVGSTILSSVAVYLVPGGNGAGASISLGVNRSDELQRLTFSELPTGGSGQFSYSGGQFGIDGGLSVLLMARAIEKGYNSLFAYGLDVTGVVNTDSSVSFDVSFVRIGGSRPHDLPSIDASGYTGASANPVTVAINRIIGGGPLGTTAISSVGAPAGVIFTQPRSNSVAAIGSMVSGDSFPVWLRRSVEAGAAGVLGDGFSLVERHQPASTVASAYRLIIDGVTATTGSPGAAGYNGAWTMTGGSGGIYSYSSPKLSLSFDMNAGAGTGSLAGGVLGALGFTVSLPLAVAGSDNACVLSGDLGGTPVGVLYQVI